MQTILVEINGFKFTFIFTFGGFQVSLFLEDEKTVKAMAEKNPDFISTLEEIANNREEIRAVFNAETNFNMWYDQTLNEGNRMQELQRVVTSKYASKEFKEIYNR